tara:strand:- start:2264 stop:2449 length:186 start_codon:yes stop_codon:yes gene_type:complete
MESLPYSRARANLKGVMDRVVRDKVPVAITRQKGEGVVLVAASEYATIEKMISPKGSSEEA